MRCLYYKLLCLLPWFVTNELLYLEQCPPGEYWRVMGYRFLNFWNFRVVRRAQRRLAALGLMNPPPGSFRLRAKGKGPRQG